MWYFFITSLICHSFNFPMLPFHPNEVFLYASSNFFMLLCHWNALHCFFPWLFMIFFVVQLLGLINDFLQTSYKVLFSIYFLIFLPKSMNPISKSVIKINEQYLQSNPKPWNQDFYNIISLNICPHCLLMNHHDGFMVPWEVSIALLF